MSEVEIENIIKLSRSKDIECQKLAIFLLEQEFPESLSYDEYLKLFKPWLFEKHNKYFFENYYYEFIDIGYIQYLGFDFPKICKGRRWHTMLEN